MPASSNRTAFGNAAETFVANYLIDQGYTILERNFRKRFGEIDIIAKLDNRIIFVEVKARTHNYFHLSRVITRTKQQKIIKTARYYCAQQTISETVCRFDAALVHGIEHEYELTYIPNAFQAPGL